jgi:hypothetical protein
MKDARVAPIALLSGGRQAQEALNAQVIVVIVGYALA